MFGRNRRRPFESGPHTRRLPTAPTGPAERPDAPPLGPAWRDDAAQSLARLDGITRGRHEAAVSMRIRAHAEPEPVAAVLRDVADQIEGKP